MNIRKTRAAVFSPASYDAEGFTIEAVASTFADVARQDKRGAYIERLDARGLDTTQLDGAPLLDSHKQGNSRDVIGIITGHRFEDSKLIVRLRLSQAEDAQPAIQRIREGTLRGVSIGYRVTRWTETTEEISGLKVRVRSAAAWSIHEASAVAIPADPRSHFRGEDMPKDLDDREELIVRLQKAHKLPDEWQIRMADAGDELTDDEIRADARDTAIAARQTRTTPQIRTASPSNDDPSVIIERQTEALAARMTGATPSDAARPFMAMGLQDFARDALTRSGVSVATLGREELMTRAMHSTSDFSGLLTGAGNRVLSDAYQRAQSPLKQLARQRTAADFRPLSVLKLGEFSGLQKVTESGEIKSVTTGEAAEGYSLETFGGMFSLTRKAIVNDDLGAFARWGEMMGAAAAETETNQLLGLLLANSGGGVKLSDGKTLFHSDHGNLIGAGADAISEGALSAARLAMRTQKGLDGKTPVNVVPKYLLVSPELETAAEKLLASIQATNSAEVNPFSGKLVLLVEPRLTGNGWFVFGDPATAPVIEYAYLSSAPGPQLSSRDGWETLGREFRVVLDFGCGVTDHRGAYRNAGT
jgi:HK97 family phage prohead protease